MILRHVRQPHEVGVRAVVPWGDQLQDSTETENKNKSEEIDRVRGTPLHDLPEGLEEFTDDIVGEEAYASSEVPASISREPLHQEPLIKVVSAKPCILTHFPKA